MVKVKFDDDKQEWIELEKGSKDGVYYDGFLLEKLKNVQNLMKKGWDCVLLIDGIEGSGKSTLSFLCGYYITNGKLTMHHVAEGTQDAVEKLSNLPDGSTLIIDEGSLLFSSKEVMKKSQIQLVKILNVIRQKTMCLIIVSPSFFDMNKYISVGRSRFLLHVYTDKNLVRGRFAYFSEKKKRQLYIQGKKNYNAYNKPKSNFVGRFYDFNIFGEDYQKLKRRSLQEAMESSYVKPIDDGEMEIRVMSKLLEHEVFKKITNKEWGEALEHPPRTIDRRKQKAKERSEAKKQGKPKEKYV